MTNMLDSVYVMKCVIAGTTHLITSHWRRSKVDWMLESIHFPRGPSMDGINYQLIVYMLVMLIMFKNTIDKYLVKAGLQ